jgi:hypothetical protein
MLDASGALLAPPAIVPLFSKGEGVTITLMLARRGAAVLGTAGAGYVCGV